MAARGATTRAEPKAPVAFSAPCNVGGPIDGILPGARIEIAGSTGNVGVWKVVGRDADWLHVEPREIVDEQPIPDVTLKRITARDGLS